MGLKDRPLKTAGTDGPQFDFMSLIRMNALNIWYVCACLWSKYLTVVREFDEKVIKQVLRNKMRQTLSFFSDYKADSNSECRTSLFSTVTTDNGLF